MARGATPEECLAELMSKATGLCKAKGGSMHLTKAAAGMLGSYAIVGAHLPMAVGAAWSARLRGSGQVAVAFFGDGATNIGAFHEALNLAAVWKLPVVFVCENNLYMEYTPIGSVTAVANPAADRAAAYRMPAEIIDGNDVVVVRDAMAAAVRRARAGDGPTIIEAQTYRHYGHSRADPAKYRPAEEVERVAGPRPADSSREPGSARLGRRRATSRRGGRARRARSSLRRRSRGREGAPAADPAEALTDVWADGGLRRWRTLITYREAVAEGIARRDAPRPDGGLPRRGHRRRRRACSRPPPACSRSSARNGSGTRRSPSRPSSVPRWAPR